MIVKFPVSKENISMLASSSEKLVQDYAWVRA